MKERLLVLAKAAPVISQKYQELVCVAGITDRGDWRRIYPLRWELFWRTRGTYFQKKQWVEYETESDEQSDHRQESRKIIETTINPLHVASFGEVRNIITPKITTMEELHAKGVRQASLGVVKPIIMDFIEDDSNPYKKTESVRSQKTLSGKKAVRLDIPEKTYSYVFKCSETCPKTHTMLCEDWEIVGLYRNCKKRYNNPHVIFEKVKQKMLSEMTKKEIYFVVGSHFRFGTFMIVGILYPRKCDI